jgi:septum site-determining protein MinD
MLSAGDVHEILAISFLGVVPESKAVLAASNSGIPVTLTDENDAGDAYYDMVDRFLGQDRPFRFMDAPKRGIFSRLFGAQ